MSLPKPTPRPLYKFTNKRVLTCDECKDKIWIRQEIIRDYSVEPPQVLCLNCGEERAIEQERSIIDD